MNAPRLVIFDTDGDRVRFLRSELHQLRYVSVVEGNGRQVTASAGLDAMWLTCMQAERYGASPPFPIHRAQVIRTPASEVAKGFPKFLIAGVAVTRDDPKDARWELALIVSALGEALKKAGEDDIRIDRVGMLPEHLLLHKVPVEVAVNIIDTAYREHFPAKPA